MSHLFINRVNRALQTRSITSPYMLKGISISQVYNNLDKITDLCMKNRLTFDYYSIEQLLVFYQMPSPVRGCVPAWFESEIRRMVAAGFVEESDWTIHITHCYNREYTDFGGDHEGSIKAPDAAIQSDGSTLPNLVLEVAFSESKEHARRKADFWLKSSDVCQVVVLIIIGEGPALRREITVENTVPITHLEEGQDDEWVGDLDVSIEVIRQGPNGTYCEHEIHLDDVTSRDSSRAEQLRLYPGLSNDITTYNDGPTFSIYPSDIFGRKFPRDMTNVSPFAVNTNTLRSHIARARRGLGRNRRNFAKFRARMAIGHDGPYVAAV